MSTSQIFKNKLAFRLSMILAFVFSAFPAFAQVTLDIPTDDIFTSINGWIVTFVPVVAIGIGIAASIAILTYVGNMIVKAFKGGKG